MLKEILRKIYSSEEIVNENIKLIEMAKHIGLSIIEYEKLQCFL